MKKLLVSLCLILSIYTFSQVTTHTVQAQETVYGISTLYGISQQELIDANPFLNERVLQIGDVLNIPGQVSPDISTLPQEEISDHEDDEFYYRVIKPQENLYRLSTEYNVSQEIIKNLNPFIETRGLQVNDVVRIPKKQTSSEQAEEVVQVPEGMHLVLSGETVYSISQLYNLEMADIYAANRNLQTEGLKTGELIRIPKSKSVSIPEGESYFEHSVVKNETVFSLLRRYEIGLEELIALNPELENGLKDGMTLKIPLDQSAILEEAPVFVTTSGKNFRDNEINIAMLMPFYLDYPNSNHGERSVAQDFYMGGQIALEQLIKSGVKVNVEVIDIHRNKEALDAFLESPSFENVDAIIGPFFEDMLAYTAIKIEKTDVPIFSPLINAKGLESYKNLYLSVPRNEFAADLIVEEMAKAYNGKQQVMILTNSDNEDIANYTREKFLERFRNAEVSITKNPNDLALDVDNRTTTTDDEGNEIVNITYKPRLVVLAADNNQLGSQFVDIITQQDPTAITGFSLFFVPAMDVFDTENTKNINALKKMGFTYTASRLVNTFGESEKQIISNFQDAYCSIPNRYMSIGYDLVYDVVERMDRSGRITEFDAKRSETRLSSKFGYQKIGDSEAKLNTEFRIIRLN